MLAQGALHLFGRIDAAERYSTGRWLADVAPLIALIAALIVAVLGLASAFQVWQTEQALLLRFGEPVGLIANNPIETPLTPEKMVVAFRIWDEQVGTKRAK
mgnify:CR=1 FL=1